MQIAEMYMATIYLIGSLIIATLTVKTVLYFKYEKSWDAIGFFYFPVQVLKMTYMKNLKVQRKRQNHLSKVFLYLLLLLGLVTMFHLLIFS